MKKTALIFLIIALLIPSAVAIVNYNLTKNAAVSQQSITEMTLKDLSGKEFSFERTQDELDVKNPASNPIKFFSALNSDAKEAELPEPLMGTEYYKATFTSYGREIVYKYYFTPDSQYCYFVDDSDKSFKISAEHAAAFLSSEYGMSLFDDAKLPVMTLSNGDVIEPAALSWKYLTQSNVYADYESQAEEVDKTQHTISGAIEMEFDIQPDSLMVVVNQDGEEVYNGTYDDIGRVEVSVGSEISVTANATWAESSERGYSGNATYSFNAVYLDKPLFYLGSTTVEVGDFVVLTAKNVADPTSITFASEPELNYTPIFFADGVYYRALIPLSLYDEHPDAYKFTVSADGIVQDINLSVTKRTFKNASSSEKIGDFKAELSAVYNTQTATRYYDGIFTDPVVDKTAKVGFARNRPDGNGGTHVHEGYDYTARKGGTVSAVNNGVVIYTGDVADCGKVVVVDHGFGLMTTYVYMTSISVSVGDEVKTDQEIGTCGYGDYLHLEVTVFGHPVDLDPLWKSGVITND